jgi:hypothetical protein
MMKKEENTLKSKDVAHILDCSPDDVLYLARTEKLRATKSGKYWMFSFRDVQNYRKKKMREEAR